MFETRKQLLKRIETLESFVLDNVAIRTPTWDYACSICEHGIHCIDGSGKHVIACEKKMPSLCRDFILDKSYQSENQQKREAMDTLQMLPRKEVLENE